jgi:hypothetical protein
MFRTFTVAIASGARLVDRLIHFGLGFILMFCGLTLALPLVIGNLTGIAGA